MAMTTNIKLRRRLRLTRGRLVGRMSQERQKLSFFLVLMFLVIFGLIVLAEVLFMEDHKSDIFYEDNRQVKNENISIRHPISSCEVFPNMKFFGWFLIREAKIISLFGYKLS